MRKLLNMMLFCCVASLSAGAVAQAGNEQSAAHQRSNVTQYNYDDPATGPDPGSAEWEYCHSKGSCN